MSRKCPRFCQQTTFWCGYKTIFKAGDGSRGRKLKGVDAPDATYFFFAPSTGVVRSWLRRWRYRLFLHRASFQPEAILLRLLHTHVRVRLREQLRQLWAREMLRRRAEEAAVAADFHQRALNGPLEPLIAEAWAWYEPLMFSRPALLWIPTGAAWVASIIHFYRYSLYTSRGHASRAAHG